MSEAFDMGLEDLPAEIPVFPLSRVILLPRVSLPLNIFEPRYLAMTRHAMKHDRLIGMIQPAQGNALQKTGCVGRIVSFTETEDGRYLITLKGICRFDVVEELALDKGGFRKVKPDWNPYRNDLGPEEKTGVCREAMMQVLERYLSKMNMLCDQWETMRAISCEKLVSTLSVICPFEAPEKQALLEADGLEARMAILQAIFEIALKEDKADDKGGCSTCH